MQTLRDIYDVACETLWASPPLAAHTRSCTLSCAKAVLETIGPKTRLGAITAETRTRLLKKLVESGRKPSTVNKYVGILDTLMSLAQSRGVGKAFSPEERKNMRVPTEVPATFTRTEQQRLIEAAKVAMTARALREAGTNERTLGHIKFPAWLEFMVETGLRVGETLLTPRTAVRPIKPSSVREVEIRDGTKVRVLYVAGKGSKERMVPLSERALAIVDEMVEINAKNFTDRNTYLFRGLAENSARNYLRASATLAGIPETRVKIHTLRRTFATQCVEDGAGAYEVQQFLGHSSMQTTTRYLGATPWLIPEAGLRLAQRRAERALAQ